MAAMGLPKKAIKWIQELCVETCSSKVARKWLLF